VALLNSKGAGSVRTLVCLPGAHLYLQVFGNLSTSTVAVVPPHLTICFVGHKHHGDGDIRATEQRAAKETHKRVIFSVSLSWPARQGVERALGYFE